MKNNSLFKLSIPIIILLPLTYFAFVISVITFCLEHLIAFYIIASLFIINVIIILYFCYHILYVDYINNDNIVKLLENSISDNDSY